MTSANGWDLPRKRSSLRLNQSYMDCIPAAGREAHRCQLSKTARLRLIAVKHLATHSDAMLAGRQEFSEEYGISYRDAHGQGCKNWPATALSLAKHGFRRRYQLDRDPAKSATGRISAIEDPVDH